MKDNHRKPRLDHQMKTISFLCSDSRRRRRRKRRKKKEEGRRRRRKKEEGRRKEEEIERKREKEKEKKKKTLTPGSIQEGVFWSLGRSSGCWEEKTRGAGRAVLCPSDPAGLSLDGT